MITPATEVRNAHPEDLGRVLALLEQANLPTAGVAEWLPHFLVAERDSALMGAAGLELYDGHALLRSVVIRSDARGSGAGALVVERALAQARALNAADVTLLTTTAGSWFPRFGFRRIERAEAPAALAASVEFREACPATAEVLFLKLGE